MDIDRAYTRLLRLYPSDYRALFGDEMLVFFHEKAAEERPSQTRTAYLCFVCSEIAGLVAGATRERIGYWGHSVYRSANLISPISLPAEWLARLTYAAFRSNAGFINRLAPDLRMMRTRRLWLGNAGADSDQFW